VLTWALIGFNLVIWLMELSLGDGLQPVIDRWGVVPHYLVEAPTVGAWVTPVTSMFMHASWLHLLWNLWFLHVFGDNIEDELGKARYLGFYLICGFGAVAAQVIGDPSSTTPMIGASGAIAGVLGGYMMLHPRAPIITLVVVFLVQLPAWIFLFVWFGWQLIHGLTTLADASSNGGVAFFAHIGGFVTGALLVRLLRRTEDDEPPGEHPERPVAPA
jgi:membrane associated rhomboid family serine protease